MEKLLIISIALILVLSGCGKEEILYTEDEMKEVYTLTYYERILAERLIVIEENQKYIQSHLNLTYIQDIDFIEEGYYDNDSLEIEYVKCVSMNVYEFEMCISEVKQGGECKYDCKNLKKQILLKQLGE